VTTTWLSFLYSFSLSFLVFPGSLAYLVVLGRQTDC